MVKSMYNILVSYESFHIPEMTSDSLAIHIYYLTREQLALGNNIVVLTGYYPKFPHKSYISLNSKSVLVKRVVSHDLFSIPYTKTIPFGFCSFFEYIRHFRGKIDIIHSHEISSFLFYYLLKRTRLKPKWFITHLHSHFKERLDIAERYPPIDKKGTRILKVYSNLEERYLSDIDFILTYCESEKENLLKSYPHLDDKVQNVGIGVDINKFKPSDSNQALIEEYGLQDSELIIMYAGALKSYKARPDIVFPMFQKVLNEIRTAKLLIVGGNIPDKSGNFKKSEYPEKFWQSVVQVPRVPLSQMSDYYNLADIFITPTMLKGVAKVTLEAMSCGVPVVGSGDYEAIQHNKTGYCFQIGDWQVMADYVIEFSDKEKSMRMGLNAREEVLKHWTWDKVAKNVQDVYESLMSEF
jgi:mannosyltransferase